MVSLDVDIGGEVRPVLFNMNQRICFCRLRGLSSAEMNEELSHPHKWDESVNRDLIYSALYAAVKSKKGVVEFNEEDVGEWMEDVEDAELSKIYQALLDAAGIGDISKKKLKKAV